MNRGFVDHSIGDRLANWEEELDMNLLTDAQRNAGMYFKFDTTDLTKGSALERAQAYQIHRNIGTMSRNDVREAEGMNDLPDHLGDDYNAPFNGTGGSPASNEEPAPSGKGNQK